MRLTPDITAILENNSPHEITSCYPPLIRLHQQLVEAGRSEEAYVVDLLAAIAFLPFTDNPNEPFGPKDGWIFARRGELDRLVAEILPVLEELARDLPHADFRARILDFCAYVKRDFRAAGDVAEAYLASAQHLLDHGHSWEALPRLERAVQVALKAGRNNHPYRTLTSALETMLAVASTQDGLFAAELTALMLYHDIGEPAELGTNAEALARRLISLPEHERGESLVQRYWQLSVEVFSGRDEARADAARAEVARSFEREAGQQASRPSIPNLMTVPKLERALKAWRTVKGAEAERERVHKRLLEVQRRSVDELKPIPFSLDLEQQDKAEQIAQTAKERVRSKPLAEALAAFALLYRPFPTDVLEEEVERELASPLLKLLPNRQVDASGRTVAVDPADGNELRSARKLAAIAQHQKVISGVLLLPAYDQLLEDQAPTFQEALALVTHHPLVRPGHEDLVVHVILDGLKGNLIQALHMLLPQLEDGLRYLLETEDALTSSYRTDGTQADYTLNVLMEERFAERLSHLLGADLLLDLRSLLVSKYGANFRNEALHGRFPSGAFFSTHAVYLWWAYLRLLMLPLINRFDDIRTEVNTEGVPEAEPSTVGEA